ncbi:hypothetical protein DBW_2540 [Desulfuromonas sp. DDH964]|uniref:hypothetical protein n=1 Tax=Desulfuromonas sp. DDH964 TaxID=1823759 RepID=UPI00078BE3D5|nr:hypothetical protein [Desulfuromonas sp. DDH964]AMV72868.1 hypothetical protein DBW_2540 [Desulfuromonas sp. DDH964]
MFPRILAVLIAAAWLLPFSAAAKPAPPEEMNQIFTDFIHTEERIEKGEWDQVRQWLVELQGKQAFFASLEQSAPAATISHFRDRLMALESALGEPSSLVVQQRFLDLYNGLLALMACYDFKVHPLIFALQNDFREMDAALKIWNWAKIDSEIKDIDEFYPHFEVLLRERGVPGSLSEGFKEELIRFKTARSQGDRPETLRSFAALNQLFSVQSHRLNAAP